MKIPQEALDAAAKAMFDRSIADLPPETRAMYATWYEHGEAGANEDFEISAGVIIQAALPAIEQAIRAEVERELRGTPEGFTNGEWHRSAVADTGDGYTKTKGWLLQCLWCDFTAFDELQAKAKQKLDAHQEEMLHTRAAS